MYAVDPVTVVKPGVQVLPPCSEDVKENDEVVVDVGKMVVNCPPVAPDAVAVLPCVLSTCPKGSIILQLLVVVPPSAANAVLVALISVIA